MSFEKALKIIDENKEEGSWTGPIREDKIAVAEELLQVQFPPSYSSFLKRFGAGDIFAVEFCGIFNDPLTDEEMIPNSIWLTLKLREKHKMPKNFVIVAESGFGPYYVIDTASKNSISECPVLLWDVNQSTEKVADSFGDFMYTLLMEAM